MGPSAAGVLVGDPVPGYDRPKQMAVSVPVTASLGAEMGRSSGTRLLGSGDD